MRVQVDGREVFVDVKDLPAFTYEKQDPIKLDLVRGDQSTTFKLPATPQAQLALGSEAMSEADTDDHVLRIGEAGNIYVEHPVRVIERERDLISLESVGGNTTWMEAARTTKLREMDLGDSGVIDVATVVASWTDEEALLYFPLINYGQVLDTINTGTDFDPDFFRPAVRVHRILSKFFSDNGLYLKVEGTLARIWKKLVIPNTEDITIAESFLTDNAAELAGSGSIDPGDQYQIVSPPYNAPQVLPPSAVEISDPGNNVAGTIYTSPFDMKVRVRINGIIQSVSALPGNSTNYRIVVYDPANGNTPLAQYDYNATGVVFDKVFTDHVLGDVELQAGDQIGVGIWSSNDSHIEVAINFRVEFIPLDIDYQMGVSVDIAGTLPELTIEDLIKALVLNRCIVINTTDDDGIVTFTGYGDYYKPHEIAGRDFSKKLAFPPTKVRPLKPRSIHFKWEEDDEDYDVGLLNEGNEATYGGAIHNVTGGLTKRETYTMPFAATAMQLVGGLLFIPVMRDNTLTGEAKFRWKPRLLVADGTAHAAWMLDGVDRTEQPLCYFIPPHNSEFALPFGEETVYGNTVGGTLASEWLQRLLRLDQSNMLRAALILHDDEMQDIDFGEPIMIHDNNEPGWYYFTSIKQKRYGLLEPTRCELIQE